MSAPVFVVPTTRLVAGRVLLDGPEGRHAATVARLGAGEDVVLVDGRGRRGHGAVAAVSGKDHLEVDVTSVTDEPVPAPWLVVVQALPKGDRGEVAVETLTEVGVDEIVPWAAARCVTRWRDVRGEKALARWRTTAQAAAKQSRRARFPVVAELAGTRDVADRLRRASLGVLLHEEAAAAVGGRRASGRRRDRGRRRPRGRASATRSWPSSPGRAPRRTGWDRRCCAPRPRAPPRRQSCCPAPPAGADGRYFTVNILVSTWIGEPSSAEASKARIW